MLDMTKRKRLIHGASEAFAGNGAEDSRRQMLGGDLFAHVGLEDLAVYSAEEIAGFVRIADEALARRKPGHPLVSVVNPEFPVEARRQREVTVVTVIHDNKSVMCDS